MSDHALGGETAEVTEAPATHHAASVPEPQGSRTEALAARIAAEQQERDGRY